MPNFLTLTELKERLHITFEDDDAELQGYIDAAESYLSDPYNGVLHRPVLATEFVETFPSVNCVSLAFPDEVLAFSVAYVDPDGVKQDLPEIYTVHNGRLALNPGESWPSAKSVTVTYTAGWPDPDFVPAGFKETGYFIARSYYEQGDKIDQDRFRAIVSFKIAGFRRATL